MRRRTFLQGTGGLTATMLVGTRAGAESAAADAGWRTFEVTTRLSITGAAGKTRAWVPMPLAGDTDYQRPLGDTPSGNGVTGEWKDPRYGARVLCAEWKEGETAPAVTVVSRIATRDRVASLLPVASLYPPPSVDLDFWRQPTPSVPISTLVKETAARATAGARTDLDKARAIYDWVVENTHRDPKVKGCGKGDVDSLLRGDLGGKCADLSALFVALARASGLPAREVFGLRVAPSRQYQSLGRTGDVTKAQHCRAEFHLAGVGWVPVDPADVRKLVLEEPPLTRTLDDPLVRKARQEMFGGWEMNYLVYNYAQDLKLPGASAGPLPFLMYPQAETAGGVKDSLEPAAFVYEINAREI